MDDLESRLAEMGSHFVPEDGSLPPVDPLLEAAHRRAVRRRAAVGGALATVVVAVGTLVAAQVPQRRAEQSRVAAEQGSSTTTSLAPSSTSVTATTAPPTTVPQGSEPETAPAGAGASPGTAPRDTSSGSATTTTVRPSSSERIGPGLWVVNVDGTGLRQLSPDGGAMSWSPDGKVIAKAAGDQIWVFDSSGSGEARTVAVHGDWAACLDWSSRGDLAWVTSSGELRISSDGLTSRALPGQYSSNVGIASCQWSPDGSRLAIGRDGLTVVDRVGEVIRRVDGGRSVVWSPDGRRLAFVRSEAQSRSSIVILEPSAADGEGQAVAPPDGSYIHGLSWSIDGRSLYVQSGRTAFKLDATTQQTTRLDSAAACCRLLTELLDGRFLAFSPSPVAEEGERKVLTISTSDFATTRTLARVRGPRPDAPVMSECRGPYLSDKRVSPDGREVAFIALAAYGPRCDSPAF